MIKNAYAFLIASPEKALCDLILSTSGLRIQSQKAMKQYLEEDLRIDIKGVNPLNPSIVEECIPYAYKRNELNQLYKLLKNEYRF